MTEKRKKYLINYRKKNKEKIKKQDKIYRNNHKKETKEWMKTHKEERKIYMKKYADFHKEDLKKNRKKYYEKNGRTHIYNKLKNDINFKLKLLWAEENWKKSSKMLLQ